MPNSFDRRIILFVNGFVHRSLAFDHVVVYLQQNVLLTGGLMMALLWWAWALPGEEERRRKDREILIIGLVAAVFVGLACRIVAAAVPFRERPIHNPDLHLQLPYGLDPKTLLSWSSFPSDHAAVYFALTVAIWMVSRQLGVIALIDTVLINCLTRLYIGVHYPSDIIAGALLGILTTFVLTRPRIRETLAKPAWPWHLSKPGPFYAVLFLCTAEVGTGFPMLHDIVVGILYVLRNHGIRLH
jgi:undecaprenyl-diphosphatase